MTEEQLGDFLFDVLDDSFPVTNPETKEAIRLIRLGLKADEVIEYCKPHLERMWASRVVSILLECDFRDSGRILAEIPKEAK